MVSTCAQFIDGRGWRLRRGTRFHIEERTDEYVRNGMSQNEARRRRSNVSATRRSTKDRRRTSNRVRWIDDFGASLVTVPDAAAQPGFSVLAILCLTLGIGANAAVFSWIEGILLRPYPLVADQERLFAVTGTKRGAPEHDDMSWPDWSISAQQPRWSTRSSRKKSPGRTLTVGDRARARARQHRLGELLRRDRRPSDARPRLRARGGRRVATRIRSS